MKITQTYSASLFPVTANLEPTEAANATRERIVRSAVAVLVGQDAKGLDFESVLELVTITETLCVKGEKITFEIETIKN